MSLCQKCLKDKTDHTEIQWTKHQEFLVISESQPCLFCQRKKSEHEEELWTNHANVVRNEMMRRRKTKLWPIEEYGRIRPYPGTVEILKMADGSETRIITPIFMACENCSLFVGDKEEELADVLGGMCFKCFCEETGQEYTWETVTPTFEEMQNRRKSRESEVEQ